jgi:hypothetical protein
MLAYSNSITGPWTPYGTGPVIRNVWSPHYSVSHVSSPHAVWSSTEGRLFLYFHGENTATRLATSTDGIHFTYDSKVIGCSHFGWGSGCEVSYARVFEATIPSKGNRFVMLLMGLPATAPTGRKIMLAWSNDGRTWTAQRTPLVTPQGTEGSNVASPHLFRWGGRPTVAYHASSGNIHLTEVGVDFNQESHLGVLYDDPTGARAASPTFLSVGGVTYMFYEQGDRLDARIAYAVEGTPTPRPRPGGQDVILDNNSSGVTVTGTWTASTGAGGYYGSDYLHDGNTGKGTKTVRFTPTLAGGTYNVYGRWAAHSNRATSAPFTVRHSGGTTVVSRDQRVGGGQWVILGTFTFAAGTGGYVQVGTTGTDGYVVADAVRFQQL